MDRAEEILLIERCKAGDESAFSALYEAYHRQAYGAACLMCGDRSLAADAVQEAFVRAFMAIDRFQESMPFKPWFFRILTNETRRLMGRRWRYWFGRGVIDEADLDAVPSPELYAVGRERAREIWEAVCSLPEQYREAIILRYYVGLREEEMARTLGIAAGTVKSRLHRAKEKMKQTVPLAWKEESFSVGV